MAKPLTRRNSLGDLYTRTPVVESQIAEALKLDPPSLLERARISAYEAPDYFQGECLVYMIREYCSRGEDLFTCNLFEVLFARCSGFIYGLLNISDNHNREDAYQEVVTNLTEKIINLESDEADFYQVRFWLGLKRLAITEFGRQVRRSDEIKASVSLDDLVEEGDLVEPATQLEEMLSREVLAECREGLLVLKMPQREAFILRHYDGWPIESKDSSKVTLSVRFGVTPRTIRNWLSEAENALRKWRAARGV